MDGLKIEIMKEIILEKNLRKGGMVYFAGEKIKVTMEDYTNLKKNGYIKKKKLTKKSKENGDINSTND